MSRLSTYVKSFRGNYAKMTNAPEDWCKCVEIFLAIGHFWKNEKNRTQIVRTALICTDFLKFFCENPYHPCRPCSLIQNCQVARDFLENTNQLPSNERAPSTKNCMRLTSSATRALTVLANNAPNVMSTIQRPIPAQKSTNPARKPASVPCGL